MILIVNDDIFILNVGDSRALSSISEHPSNSMIAAKASLAAINSQTDGEKRESSQSQQNKTVSAGGHYSYQIGGGA